MIQCYKRILMFSSALLCAFFLFLYGNVNAQTPNKIAVGLWKQVTGVGSVNYGGATAVFDSTFSDGIGGEDSPFLQNGVEGISFTQAGRDLAVNGKKPPLNADTLPLKLWFLTLNATYQIKVDLTNFSIPTGLTGFLKDNYLNKLTPFAVDTTIVSFVPTTNLATYTNRFVLVFKTTPLAVTNLQLVARKKESNKVSLIWGAAKEVALNYYSIQKSSDGRNYASIGTVNAQNRNNTHYTWEDAVVNTNGAIYYRLQAVNDNGTSSYSNITNVNWNTPIELLQVNPNPVRNHLLSFSINAPKDNYTLLMSDASGKTVTRNTISHLGDSKQYNLSLNKEIAKGVYHILLVGTLQSKVYYTSTVLLQ